MTKERLREQDVIAGVEIKTIDKWCFQLLSRAGLGVTIDAGSYDDSIRDVIAGLKNGDVEDVIQGIEHVVIDEAQDIYGVRLELLDLILKLNLIRGGQSSAIQRKQFMNTVKKIRLGHFYQD